MVSTPTVSVIMPVHNSEQYLAEAIDSILCQTWSDFELIIINDGSQDNSTVVISEYQKRDSRIRVYTQENLGVTFALRRGWQATLGEYIARMDADDISLPKRFEQQVKFLNEHPEIGVVGTWVKTFNSESPTIWRYPTDHPAIKAQLLFGPPLAHPSVMMRKALFDSAQINYDPTYKRAQDYALWVEAAKHFHLANIPQVHLLYRLHSQQVRQLGKQDQQYTGFEVQKRQLLELGIAPTPSEAVLHASLYAGDFHASIEYLDQVEEWLLKLDAANRRIQVFSQSEFVDILIYYWMQTYKYIIKRIGTQMIHRFFMFPLITPSVLAHKVSKALKTRFVA
jgi:glycosyltransferase involved in cell wall biosynthesis